MSDLNRYSLPRAQGGYYIPQSPLLVGENGKEIVYPVRETVRITIKRNMPKRPTRHILYRMERRERRQMDKFMRRMREQLSDINSPLSRIVFATVMQRQDTKD